MNWLKKFFKKNNEKRTLDMSKTNYVNKEDTEKVIKETLNYVSNAVGSSLGPYGFNTIIQNIYGEHSVSKDGYTILSNLKFGQVEYRGIFDNIIRISRNLVRTVGDGSTSAIIIAERFYYYLNKFQKTHKINANILKELLKLLEKKLINSISQLAKKVDVNDVTEIANIAKKVSLVSTNNNQKMSDLISEIYSKIGTSGNINVETSKSEFTTVEYVDGFKMDYRFSNPLFVTDRDNNQIVYENPVFLMSDGTIIQKDLITLSILIDGVQSYRLQQKKINPEAPDPVPFILLAPKIDPVVFDFFKINKEKNPHAMIAYIEIPTSTELSKNKFYDLATFLGARVLKRMEGEEFVNNYWDEKNLGTCKKFIATPKNCFFIEGGGDKETIENYIKKLEKEKDEIKQIADHVDHTPEIWKLESRIHALKGNMATIYVGGQSELEKKNIKYLVEDAVQACHSTFNHGYVFGGNLVIPYYISKNFEDLKNYLYTRSIHHKLKEEQIADLLNIIKDSFLFAYIRVLDNYYNPEANKGNICEISKKIAYDCIRKEYIFNLIKFENEVFDKTDVINSVETDVEILKSVFSIITLLVTSNQMLS